MSLFGRHKVRPNMMDLGNGMYVVRSQAGFNSALKKAVSAEALEYEPDNWPKSYPCVVSITEGYCGHHFPQVRCVSVNHMKEALVNQ